MAEPTSPFCELRSFRAKLHACLTRRTDALLELADALLCPPAIPSLAHLSLEAVHQRGWGSTYAALAHGRVDVEALRDLLARHPLHDGEPIYAVEVSTWPRCDAETSPERGYYYHPPATAPANRSWPAGRSNGSASSASPVTAGRPRWTLPAASDGQPQPGRHQPDPHAGCPPACRQSDGAAVCLRRRLRPDRPGVGAQRPARRDPGPAAAGSLLLRRPATGGGLAQGWPATPPRRQARHRQPGHLAGSDHKPPKTTANSAP
jgi:hypothetical protein